MTINELLGKPVWQMTGEELLFLARHGNCTLSNKSVHFGLTMYTACVMYQ
ncbi:hypothetical protein HMPREF9151_02044 [Hoylesella saccharolytica F0055]|uniref:Uncharacterized protein n=1 Tax=Hoylesella saccharolytica F0055 TaxID=1127699 RepID=L1N475_9BACT|nr:hypothetical protein HMPREF9151_02044 [Hoylesella saccharolytica F0055]